MSRVVVAMSGGVDSSVAALRLRDAGHEVIGVTLHLWDYPDDDTVQGRCCAPEDIHDAQRVADVLGFPHYAFDRRALFRSSVVEPFVASYLVGETPSPCVHCNRSVKIAELIALADRLGASHVATGHYARVRIEDGQPRLYRGIDAQKDQSYFLHMLRPQSLARLMFPLGESTKAEVRQEALTRGIPGATKGESQELCFVPTGRYDSLIAQEAATRLRPGPIVDETGKVVGRHDGIHGFTIGQRRNLGVAVGTRAYVVGLDAETGTVRLGPREQLECSAATLTDSYLAPDVTLPRRAEVAVRYRSGAHAATLLADDTGAIQVHFERPVAAVVPGQYAVFYATDRVLGGGRIATAHATAPR